MSSPVKLDAPFTLPTYATLKFIPLGQQRGNKGITHTLFLSKTPIHSNFFLGEPCDITGYCSYRLIYNNNDSLLIGVLFLTPNTRTIVSDFTLSVMHDPVTMPEALSPSFILESCGILVFIGTDSSVLAICSEVDSALLIKTE